MATLSFEQSLEKLEGIVRQLESGSFSLDDSLKAFEEGIALTRQCEKLLTKAKGKVEKLIQKESGELELSPLDEANGS